MQLCHKTTNDFRFTSLNIKFVECLAKLKSNYAMECCYHNITENLTTSVDNDFKTFWNKNVERKQTITLQAVNANQFMCVK